MTHDTRFSIGDEVWWHIPTVMDHCNTWSPDITKPTTIIAVKDRENWPRKVNPCHPQLVRVSPNYCPWGDEFDGNWLLPVGIKSHNDKAYRELSAQAIEARSATTAGRGPQDESAVLAEDAPERSTASAAGIGGGG